MRVRTGSLSFLKTAGGLKKLYFPRTHPPTAFCRRYEIACFRSRRFLDVKLPILAELLKLQLRVDAKIAKNRISKQLVFKILQTFFHYTPWSLLVS